MEEEIINQEEWRELSDGKPGKILVRLVNPTIGYFRPKLNLLNANDFIVSRIGTQLGLPVAKVQFLTFGGIPGSVSVQVAPEPQTWSSFPFKDKISEHLTDPADLLNTAIFDAWIYNEDRNPQNFLYSKNTRSQKYDVHLIDNTHTLCGPSGPPYHDKDRFSLADFVKIEEIRAIFTQGSETPSPLIEKIERLGDEFIKQIIAQVPPEFITEEARNATLNLLLSRKSLLRNKLEELHNNN